METLAKYYHEQIDGTASEKYFCVAKTQAHSMIHGDATSSIGHGKTHGLFAVELPINRVVLGRQTGGSGSPYFPEIPMESSHTPPEDKINSHDNCTK
jgi:hypothetical protein